MEVIFFLEIIIFFSAFLAIKGKNKEDDEHFQFCDECEKEFRNYLAEETIKELKTKNIAHSEILTHRFSKSNFAEENWQKYQTSLAENITRHSKEWKIKQVNYQPYEREKPREDGGSRLIANEIRKETILYHQSFGLEYDQNGSLVLENYWDPRKIYFQHDFLPEKWTEIEKKLSQNEEMIESKNQPQFSGLIISTAIFLAIGMIILQNYLTRKKQKKLKL